MRFCYQAATPDVAISPSVTAFQGDIGDTFSRLAEIGYDGVELMTLDPSKLDWESIKQKAAQNGLGIALVCTGEVYGQLGISFCDENPQSREKAISRVKEIIDFAGYLGANVNIGRVRGQYSHDVPAETTYSRALNALREICGHAAKKNVTVTVESVTIMQTNFINTVAEAAKLVDDAGCGNLKLMMDIFHLNIEEKNIFETIEKYKDYNVHVHLADNNRRYPGHCGLDFERIINAFRDVGYDGAFCTEIYQIPDQESAARGAMAHLKPIFEKVYNWHA